MLLALWLVAPCDCRFFTVTPSNSFPLRPLRLSAFALDLTLVAGLVGGLSAGIACVQQRAGKKQHAAGDDIHTKPDIFICARIPHTDYEIQNGQVH